MTRTKTVALDFDGTCVENNYPKVGCVIGAEYWLRRCHENWDIQYILWTMRTGPELERAVQWCWAMRIPLWATNNNPDQKRWSSSKKIYAHTYLEDTAIGMPLITSARKPYVDWDQLGPMFEEWCATHAEIRAE